MKKFDFLHLVLTVVLAVFVLAACGDKDKDSDTPNTPVTPVTPGPDEPGPDEPGPDDPTPDEPVTVARMVGTWKLTEWTVDSELGDRIYLEILADNTFVLYENITSHGFNKMTGTFTFDADEEIINGTYSDGKAWGSSYIVAMPNTKTMRWTAIGTEDTCVYTRADIPADIVRTSRTTRSGGSFPFL